MCSGFTHPTTAPEKTLSDFVQKRCALRFFRPRVVSAQRADFWKKILGRLLGSDSKVFKCTLVKQLFQKPRQTSLDIEISLPTYITGHLYDLSNAHTPPKCKAGGFPAH